MLKNNQTGILRLLVFLFSGTLIIAAFLISRLNSVEVSIYYLILLAGIVLIGLLTNPWGGVLASAVAGLALVLIDRYFGVYPRESYLINIASELVSILLVGPLAGILANILEKRQRTSENWQRAAEQQTLHDDHFGTLKDEWAQVRLAEEFLRAERFRRPLTVVLLELEIKHAKEAHPEERLAALQALVRLARSATQPPAIVAYHGRDQVLLVLPEQDHAQAGTLVAGIQSQAQNAMYFPPQNGRGLGKPLGEWGTLHSALVSLDSQHSSAQELLHEVQQALEE